MLFRSFDSDDDDNNETKEEVNFIDAGILVFLGNPCIFFGCLMGGGGGSFFRCVLRVSLGCCWLLLVVLFYASLRPSNHHFWIFWRMDESYILRAPTRVA